MVTDASRCCQMLPDAPRSRSQLLPNAETARCFLVLTSAPACLQLPRDALKRMLLDAPIAARFSQLSTDALPKSSQMLHIVFGKPGGSSLNVRFVEHMACSKIALAFLNMGLVEHWVCSLLVWALLVIRFVEHHFCSWLAFCFMQGFAERKAY